VQRNLTALLVALAGVTTARCPALEPNDEPRVMQFVYTVWPQRGQYFHRMGLQNRFAVDAAEVDISAPPGSDRENLLGAIERYAPDLQYDNNRVLTMDWWGRPEVCPTPLEWIERQKALGREVHRQMHEAGAGGLFTYVSAFRIFGNYDKRQGFWAFYDNWDDYGPLHFGPRPDEDPWDWISVIDGERRQWRVNPDDYYGYRRYNVCVQNPHWRRYMEAVCTNIAEDGIDGVFVDNTMHRCECGYCRRAFEEHLRSEYTPDERERFFGSRDVSELRINSPDSVPLQIETRRVWSKSMAGLLEHLRRGGSAAEGREEFMVITNGTAYGLLPGYCCAISDWADAGMTVAFNEHDGTETGMPQREIADGLCFNELQDQITHYATVSGLDRPGVRAAPQQARYYLRAHPETFALAMFEALAFDGIFCDTGNLIGVYDLFPNTEALREELYRFYHERHDLYSGVRSRAEVGIVLAFVDESIAENREYELEARCTRNLLLDHHIPFDLIPEAALTPERLARYSVVLLPGITCMSDDHAAILREYVRAGGGLLASGDVGTRHLCGAVRERSCLADVLPDGAGVRTVGAGRVAWHPGWLWRDGLPDISFRREAGWYRRMALRGHNPLERLQGDGNRELFADTLNRLLPENASIVAGDAPGVRVSLFEPRDHADRRLIAHLVNYDVRWDADEERSTDFLDQPTHAELRSKRCTVVLRTPQGTSAREVALHRPEAGTVQADFEQLADGIAVEVPDLRIYAAIEVSLAEAEPDAEGRTQDLLGASLPAKAAPPFFALRDEAARPLPEPLMGRRQAVAVTPWLGLDQVVIVPRESGERLSGTFEVPERSDWGARFWVMGPTGAILHRGAAGGDAPAQFEVLCERGGLHLICGDGGYAVWRVALDNAAIILPTTASRPIQLAGTAGGLRFLVPPGVEEFSVTTRAAEDDIRLVVNNPAGGTALDVSPDRREQEHAIAVPDGQAGVWWLTETRGERDYHRTMPLYFSQEIPGFVAR